MIADKNRQCPDAVGGPRWSGRGLLSPRRYVPDFHYAFMRDAVKKETTRQIHGSVTERCHPVYATVYGMFRVPFWLTSFLPDTEQGS
jgi:hypothetical protein